MAYTHTALHAGLWKRLRACKAPVCDSMVQGKQAVIESTEEVLCLDECEQITHLCHAMVEGKDAFSSGCVHVTMPSCLVKEGKQACVAAAVDMTAFEESNQGGENPTRKQCVCLISSFDAEDGGNRNWVDLTPDLLANILALLPLDQLIMEIPFVCKAWKLASEHPLCWEKLDFSDPTLAISGTPRLIERALRYCQGRLLEINAPCLRDRHCLDLLACSSPLLQKLYIRESSANDEWATYAAPLLPNLEELDLSLCKASFAALIAFGKHCRGITKVIWHKEFYVKLPVDDADALAIAQHYSQLKHLEFNANALSAEGLRAIVDNCPALTYLDLEGCPNVIIRGAKKLLDLCRARFEYFGNPYDEFSLAAGDADDDDDDDDDDDYDYDDDEDDDDYDDDDDDDINCRPMTFNIFCSYNVRR